MDLKSNEKFASLTINSGALIDTNSKMITNGKYSALQLENMPIGLGPVPDSMLYHLKNSILPEKWSYVKENFPLYTGRELPYHLSVRSTVLNITMLLDDATEALEYKFPMILTLSVDVPDISVQNGIYDFCLGKADLRH